MSLMFGFFLRNKKGKLINGRTVVFLPKAWSLSRSRFSAQSRRQLACSLWSVRRYQTRKGVFEVGRCRFSLATKQKSQQSLKTAEGRWLWMKQIVFSWHLSKTCSRYLETLLESVDMLNSFHTFSFKTKRQQLCSLVRGINDNFCELPTKHWLHAKSLQNTSLTFSSFLYANIVFFFWKQPIY